MKDKIKNFKDLKIWQKSLVPERGNDSELDKMFLTVHYSLTTIHCFTIIRNPYGLILPKAGQWDEEISNSVM